MILEPQIALMSAERHTDNVLHLKRTFQVDVRMIYVNLLPIFVKEFHLIEAFDEIVDCIMHPYADAYRIAESGVRRPYPARVAERGSEQFGVYIYTLHICLVITSPPRAHTSIA